MKSWYPSVVLAFAFAAAMRAQTAPPPLQCSASAPAVPAVRVEGGAELVGDYVVTCTGGTPTGAQQTVPAVTVTLSANTNITSRLLAAGWSEALLLVDEPAAGSQLACATTNGTCTILGVANGKGTYSGVTGRPNIFQGQQPFNQQLIFVFPFDPPGANTRYLRFTNVRVNALALGTPANVTLSSLASNGISISNPAQNVALTQPSASFDTRFVESGRNGLADFTLSFTERFAAAVKTRTLAAYANTETSPAPVNQNVPGQPAPGTETGFYNNSLPNISGHGNLGVAGLADNGSRFLVTVSRIPSGVTVFTAPSVNLSRQFQNTGVLRLISADATGRGPFSPAGACCAANVALTTDANGTAQAVFEVLSTAPAQLEIADIPFLLSYSTGAPAVTSLSVTAALAPTSTAATADLTAPLPRFNSPVAISLSAIGITPTSIPQGVPGSPYSVQFAASGGSPPYFWTTPATLPPGLTLSANGVLSGTPPSAGSYPVTITATDSVQAAAIYQYTLVVAAAALQIAPATLANGTVGTAYSQTLSASGGTSPYTFYVAQGSTLPGGLTLTTNGLLSGTPNTASSYTFTVNVTDAANGSGSLQYTLTVVAGSTTPLLSVGRTSIDFQAIVGGDAPPPQGLVVLSSAGPTVNFAMQVDAGVANTAAPSWLTVRLSSGVTPAGLLVSVDQGNLAAGTYTARIRFTVVGNTSQPPIDVLVTLTVTASTQQLDVSPSIVKLRTRVLGDNSQDVFLVVRNSGGGAPVAFSASAVRQSSWITDVSPSNGRTAPNGPVLVRVRLNTQGLPGGSYRDVIRFTWSGGNVDVPVVIFIAEPGPILAIDVTGQRFQSRQGGGYSLPQAVQIANIGDPGTVVNWTAEILYGGEWLSLGDGPANGSLAAGRIFVLPVTGRPAAADRPVGGSYGLVRISDPGAINSPQYVVIVLDQAPSTSPTLPDFAPGPFVISVPAGSGTQIATVKVYASSATAKTFYSSAVTYDGGSWLTTSSTGPASTGNPGTVTATINTANLTPGIRKGQINVSMSGVLRTKDFTVIVTPAGASTISAAADRPTATPTANCVPARLAITQAGVTDSFAVPAGWPATLVAQLTDDCGTPVTNGSVSASFSNGDPPLTLDSDRNTGSYSATWQPGNVTPQMTVTIRASSGALAQTTAQISGTVNANTAPILAKGGTVNNLNPLSGGALAPGTVAQVFGSGLAGETASVPAVPLPTLFRGTTVLVGGSEAPLYFVSGNQLNVQIPNELKPNRQYPVIVNANGALTVPDTIDVVPFQPGVAQFSDGGLIAQHAADFKLVTAANPAKPGEFLIMYLVGMGATTVTVRSGTAAPGGPFAEVTEKATVTVDGQSAAVGFAGMTPGGVGLFQINFKVPDGAATGNLEVVVKQGTVTANVTRLPVQR